MSFGPGQLPDLLAHVRAVRVVGVDVERRVLLAEQEREAEWRDGRLERLRAGVVRLGGAAGDDLLDAGVRACGVDALVDRGQDLGVDRGRHRPAELQRQLYCGVRWLVVLGSFQASQRVTAGSTWPVEGTMCCPL